MSSQTKDELIIVAFMEKLQLDLTKTIMDTITEAEEGHAELSKLFLLSVGPVLTLMAGHMIAGLMEQGAVVGKDNQDAIVMKTYEAFVEGLRAGERPENVSQH